MIKFRRVFKIFVKSFSKKPPLKIFTWKRTIKCSEVSEKLPIKALLAVFTKHAMIVDVLNEYFFRVMAKLVLGLCKSVCKHIPFPRPVL